MLKVAAAPAVLGFALLSTSAFAQTPQGAGDEGEAIIVTGSRIPQPNLQSATPITVVGAEDLKTTGTTRVEDMLNSLPQVFAGQGSSYSNGSTGTATINLRGFGAERNLVLVNGRRLVPGDPGSSAADINAIPAALVKRVDLLTGGASSVYGADAVTGVVNFVMDTDFEGFRIDSQYSLYNHNNRIGSQTTGALDARGFPYPKGMTTDGGAFDATLSFGTSFDDGRGHITAYVGYRKINPITQDKRDYSSCGLSANTAAAVAGGGRLWSCGGSATSANGAFIVFENFPGESSESDVFTSTIYQVGSDRSFLPGYTPYNFNPTNYYQRPDERYTAGFFADYEISPALKPYMEFMFMDDRTVAQIAASGDFGNTLSLNCDNPLLSAQQKAIVCNPDNLLVSTDAADIFTVVGNDAGGRSALNFIDPVTGQTYNKGFLQILRRNVEGGSRRDDLQHTSYRAVMGMKGELGSAWQYDAFFQYGRTIFSETYYNDFSVSRMTKALDVVAGPDGTPICRSTRNGEDPNCVPWDIFAPGGVTPEALAYLQTPGFQRGINGETVVSGSIAGALGEYGIQMPWATEGVGVALGAEYRKESLEFSSDTAFQTGDLAGQGAPTLPVSGSFDVREIFGEVNIPIVQDSFIKSFVIKGGYRYSDYGNSNGASFSTDTYKIEFELAPVRDIRFRGGYNRAVRAPTVQDLFAPQRVALDGSTDPCAGFQITAATEAAGKHCVIQGLSLGQTVTPNPAEQYNGLIGGDPNLVPEIADTYTLGVVLQPTFVPGLAISVDWWKIKLDQAISTVGADLAVGLCTQTGDPTFCSLVHRDGSGSLWRTSAGYIEDLTQNIGGLSSEGVDINGQYSMDVGNIGTFTATFVGTYLVNLKTDTGIPESVSGITPVYDCAGLFGNVCGTPNPKWRHQAKLAWTSNGGGLGASIRWRYFDGTTLDALESNPNIKGAGGQGRPALAKIPSVSYFDLALTARVGDHYTFRLGANNVLDKQPPLMGSQVCPAGPCNGNVWAQVYDALGRYIYAGITLDF